MALDGDYLPPVVATLTMEIDDFLKKVAAAKAAMNGLKALGGAIPLRFDINAASLAAAVAAAKAAAASAGPVTIPVKFDVDMTSLAAAMAAMKAATVTLSAVGAAAGAAAVRFRAFGVGLTLTRTALHWIIAGGAEILAVLIPALVALGAGMAVGAEGAQRVADRMQAVYTATEATSAMLHVTAGQAIGLSGALQQAQRAADPGVYELLGAAVNGANSRFGGLAQMGLQVIQVMDRFAARVNLDLQGSLGARLQGLVSTGVADLTRLGQVFGNLGHAILNVASAMPGLAQVLLSLLAGFTGLIRIASSIPAPLLMIGFGMEEMWRWGGLLAGILARVATGMAGMLVNIGAGIEKFALFGGASIATGEAVGGMGLGLTSVASFLSGPWGWAAIAGGVALAGLIIWMSRTQTAAERMTASMEKSVNTANFVTGLGMILGDLSQLEQAYQKAASASSTFATANVMSNRAAALAGPQMSQAAQDAGTYSAAISHLIVQAADILGMNTKIDGSYYTLSQAMALASLAGLNIGTAFDRQGQLTALAAQQINNLLQGYRAMGQEGSVLANDISAVNVQALEQQTRVQGLNQAWDSFLSNATGGTSALGALNSDLSTMGNVTVTATSQINAFAQGSQGMQLSVNQAAQALRSFSGTSAQVWQNYDAALSQAQKVTDFLRTAASQGAVTQAQYVNSIRGVVAELLPYAARSRTATAELSALAQEAGGPATSNYRTLASWVGNTKQAQDALNSTVNTATQYMSNLSGVASSLAGTLASTVDAAIAAGSVNIKGITDATQNFTNALRASHGMMSGPVRSSLTALAAQLQQSGISAHDAASIIYQLAIQQGDTARQAQALAGQVQNLINKLNSIPANVSSNINVFTRYQAIGTVPSLPLGLANYPGHAVGTPSAPPGWAWVGERGRELINFRGGERVLPNSVSETVTSGAGQETVIPPINVHVDGKKFFTIQQSRTFQYNRRNGISVTGTVIPG